MINSKLKTQNSKLFILLLLSVAYVVMWIGGVGVHVFGNGLVDDTPWAAPVFLLLAGLIVVVTTSRYDLPGLLAVTLLGFAAEVVGVRYGFLFGAYDYTPTLNPQLFGVPLVMASAWLVLVAYIKQALVGFDLPAWLEVLLSSLWITAIDLIIDPLASGKLGYWRWVEEGSYYGVPAHNFIGWFAVSLLIFGLIRLWSGHNWKKNIWAGYVGLSIILFFTLIALSHGLLLAGGIGILLCAVQLISRR